MAIELANETRLVKKRIITDPTSKPSGPKRTPIAHNYLHDLESLWWLHAWTMIARVNHIPSLQIADRYFDGKIPTGGQRVSLFIQDDVLTDHFEGCLHQSVEALLHPSNFARSKILDEYQNQSDSFSPELSGRIPAILMWLIDYSIEVAKKNNNIPDLILFKTVRSGKKNLRRPKSPSKSKQEGDPAITTSLSPGKQTTRVEQLRSKDASNSKLHAKLIGPHSQPQQSPLAQAQAATTSQTLAKGKPAQKRKREDLPEASTRVLRSSSQKKTRKC